MAKHNLDTSDITEQMGMHITILKELKNQDSYIDWYRMCGSRKRGLRVLYEGVEILELWSDNKDISYENVGSICTKYVDSETKKSAIPVNKFDYTPMGEKVLTTYAYHDDWSFKWSKHASSYGDIRTEVMRGISAYKKSEEYSSKHEY